ncbi:ABC transporter ATP-binding protein [Microvirga pudoricolor]|uniref:ABC transporter ATP-binding protein n=1 Tax=Microvirga pudoricolor TaxID=2778729 RepID=UPI00194E8570|nr:ABC transporter ATP-binding protein [Microvirga pudoricolor]MBM6593836.1 ABC transporter ATP-binding protein [Microvirga pudoricolor]
MTRLDARGLAVDLGRKPVLGGIDLAFEAGSLTVVVGPNGAGKTTLIRALAGLLKPRQGAVRLDGRALSDLSGHERARSIAYLPQSATLAWPLPVAGVAALGRLPHGETPDALTLEGREAVRTALHAVGLEGFETRPATDLSGGERARVLLARALATQAPVLLVDEPVAALDPRHQLIVLDILRAKARSGATVVAIMHDLTLAARHADRIVLLEGGRIRAEGPPETVLTEAHLAESFGIAAHVTHQDGRLTVTPDRPLP